MIDGRLRPSYCRNLCCINVRPSICLGVLFESDRDATGFCRCLEQFGLRVQRSGGDLVGNTSFREGGGTGPKLFGCLHQFGECAERGEDI